MFQGIHGKCCKLHDFVRVAVEMEGFVLRALIFVHFPEVIRCARFGIQLRLPDPAVDVFNETHVVQRGTTP